MARPPKQGIDYFPKDVGFYNDFKVMDLLALHGPIGVTIYEVILTEVYRNGYYLAEPIERISTNIVRIIGNKWVQKRLVSQVILDCGELGLFETTLLKHGVITSVGIQRRYANVTSRNKVNKEKYWLIDEDGQPLLSAPITSITVAEINIAVAETSETVTGIPQKESKGNKIKQNKRYGSELETNPHPVAYKLSLIDGTQYLVHEDEVDLYKELYPAIDTDQEFRKMIGWINANPNNRKTARGIKKFVNGWLSRAQDSARPSSKGSQPHNKFHNFEQRDTNYDAMVVEDVKSWLKGGDKADG